MMEFYIGVIGAVIVAVAAVVFWISLVKSWFEL